MDTARMDGINQSRLLELDEVFGVGLVAVEHDEDLWVLQVVHTAVEDVCEGLVFGGGSDERVGAHGVLADQDPGQEHALVMRGGRGRETVRQETEFMGL